MAKFQAKTPRARRQPEAESYGDEVVRYLAARLQLAVAEYADPHAAFGEPGDLAERMLRVVPDRSAWADVIGPAYTQAGLARAMGVSRQAVHDRTSKGRLWALRTADDAVVYPAKQFVDDFGVVPGLIEVVHQFDDVMVDEWTVASWLTSGQPTLKGASVLEVLRAGTPPDRVLALARETAHRWNR